MEPDAVDEHGTVALRDHLARQADDSFHEGAALAAAVARRGGGGVEDDDVASVRIAEAVREPVRDHAIREGGLAAGRGARAVQRRLHRRRRDPVRLRHLGFEDEHEEHGDGDRHKPVDDGAPRSGQPAGRKLHAATVAPSTARSTTLFDEADA